MQRLAGVLALLCFFFLPSLKAQAPYATDPVAYISASAARKSFWYNLTGGDVTNEQEYVAAVQGGATGVRLTCS